MTNKQKRKIEKKYFGFVPTKEDRTWCEKESDFEKSCWKQLNYYLNRTAPIDDSIKPLLENLRALRMTRVRERAYFDQIK